MSRNLKIAMFGHKRVPSREGGIEVVVEELCTRMVKAGHKVCCYNRKGHHVSGFVMITMSMASAERVCEVINEKRRFNCYGN